MCVCVCDFVCMYVQKQTHALTHSHTHLCQQMEATRPSNQILARGTKKKKNINVAFFFFFLKIHGIHLDLHGPPVRIHTYQRSGDQDEYFGS